MIRKLKKAKENKKGFTLVELIVVLVILAILIALLVPSLTGYIDKARQKSVLSEARLMLEAIQTEESEEYAKSDSYGDTGRSGEVHLGDNIAKLAEAKDGFACQYFTDSSAKVTDMFYKRNGYTVVMTGDSWEVSSK